PLKLHHILDIAGQLHSSLNDPLPMNIVTPMKLKFLNYWHNIPLLYSFAFILYPRAKIRGFHNVPQLLSQTIGTDYTNYFEEVRIELYKLFNKYETKFGAVRLQRLSQAAGSTGKKRTAWGKIYGGPASDSSTPLASASAPSIASVSEL